MKQKNPRKIWRPNGKKTIELMDPFTTLHQEVIQGILKPPQSH